MRQGGLVPDLFLFLKKALFEVNASGLRLSFNQFRYHQLGRQQKQSIQNFRIMIHRYAQFWFFKKVSGNSFSTTFFV